MKEVTIREVSNGYVVECFDYTTIHKDFRDVIVEVAEYYEEPIPLKI